MSSLPQMIHQDEAMVVLEKPAGLPSLPAKPGTQDPNTVEGWLQGYFPGARLVHRLDNDTSGLMIAAQNEEILQKLKGIWHTPQVVKKYTARVWGRPPPQGKITMPIAHHPRKKKKMVVGGKKARPAVTEYKTIRAFPDQTLLEVTITTGVRHQIRVHLASLGHPIVGDPLYQKGNKKTPWTRQALHLSYLKLPHPVTGELKEWHSPYFFNSK